MTAAAVWCPPQRRLPVFVFRAGLGMAMPPSVPKPPARLGSYCIKATCTVLAVDGSEVARVTGYDRTPEVAKTTERACRLHVRDHMGTRGRALRCDDAQVVILPNVHDSMPCQGELFFAMGGDVKKLV